MTRLRLRLVVLAVLQSLALLGLLGMKQFTLATGTEVVLETVPIDPRSLFRGDYVDLRYAINSIPADPGFAAEETVYVLLRKDQPYWRLVSVHHEPPSLPADHVALKGQVWTASDARLEVVYGIETFFVPEGEGLALERPAEGETVSVLAAVDRFGKAGIKAILVNGEPRYRERLF